VIADSFDSGVNGGLPDGTIVTTLGTTLGNATGDIQLTANGAVLDAVTWTNAPAGATIQLDPDFEDVAANDDPSNFCPGTTAYGAGNLGTPGAVNDQCPISVPAGQCDDGGTVRDIVKPAAGDLVITEFLSNPFGSGTDATQEWFEIKNIGATDFDLNGLKLEGASSSNTVQSTECKTVVAGGYALFAHSTDPMVNGGLPDVDTTFTFALGSKITIYDGADVLDAVTFSTGSDGKSKQLQPGMTDTVSNDTATNFCDADTATQQYNPDITNYGTPKADNVCP
jgi:hypothetical protein